MKHLKYFENLDNKEILKKLKKRILDLSNLNIKDLNDLDRLIGVSLKSYVFNMIFKVDLSNNNLISLISGQFLNKMEGLNILDISHNELINLDGLDTSHRVALVELDCSYNNLKNLVKLNQIEKLNCSNNKLEYLPSNMFKLKNLDCSHNNLYTLPLPIYTPELKRLDCSYNNINELPYNLSKIKITHLDCSNNIYLNVIPKLPKTLKYLNCENTGLPFNDLNGYNEFVTINNSFNGFNEIFRKNKDIDSYIKK